MLSHKGTQIIKTERLILRSFLHTDNDDMLTYWVSDPKIQSLYSEPTYTTKEEVRELLEKYISSYEKSDYYRWAVIEKESNICIGQIAIFLVDNKNHFCEIEYALGRAYLICFSVMAMASLGIRGSQRLIIFCNHGKFPFPHDFKSVIIHTRQKRIPVQ